MNGKVAFVTGAGSGIGRAAALLLASRGASVTIADINVEGGEQTLRSITSFGGRAIFLQTDVAREDDVQDAIKHTVSEFGGLDLALNNAGMDGQILPLSEQPTDVVRRVLEVNVLGVFFGMKHQIPAILDRGGGAIVNTSSIAGVRGHPGLAPYVAAKHAVNGLTKSAAIEYADRGIRVNALCPGGVRTPMLEQYLASAPELKAAIIDRHPMRRMGEAEEMAEAAIWLLSSAASYVNGHELVVDGGKIVSDV